MIGSSILMASFSFMLYTISTVYSNSENIGIKKLICIQVQMVLLLMVMHISLMMGIFINGIQDGGIQKMIGKI
jgi:hypothetical protein